MTETTFRLAGPADLPGAAAVHIESCLDIYRPIAREAVESGLLERNLRRIWAGEKLKDGDFIMLAEADGETVGLATVRPVKYDEPYIDHFHVRPHLKGQGIGRRLLAATFVEMRKRGLETVWLDVAADNDAAQGFYAAVGGVIGDETIGDLFGTPVPAIKVRWPALPATEAI